MNFDVFFGFSVMFRPPSDSLPSFTTNLQVLGIKARGGGVPGSEKNFFSHFVICCSPTHGLSKMGSLSSQLPTVAEICVAEDMSFSRVFDVFYRKRASYH